MLGDIGDYLKATFGEIGHHPLQAAGAALGVPGYDPFFGGIFNNHKGGALLSPTGNFTSSAWNDMYKDNPNSTAGLNLFHKANSVADVVAPMIAGGYASGALGGGGSAAAGGGGNAGFGMPAGGELDLSGSLGNAPTGLFSGLNPGASMGSSYGGSALGGGFSGQMAGMQPLSFAGGASGSSPYLSMLKNVLQQQSSASQQRAAQPSATFGPTPQIDEAYGLQGYSPIRTYGAVTPQQTLAQRLMNYGGNYA